MINITVLFKYDKSSGCQNCELKISIILSCCFFLLKGLHKSAKKIEFVLLG